METAKFRELREQRGLSMEDVASRAGISWRTVYNMDRGHVPKQLRVRVGVAQALDMTEAELFGNAAATEAR